MTNTTRDQYIRAAARYLVEKINADAILPSDCTIDEIEHALRAPFFTNLAQSAQYPIEALKATQRRALAKAIASAVANHPDRVKVG